MVLGTPSKQQQSASAGTKSKPLDVEAFNTYPLRSSSKCTSPSQPQQAGDGAHVLLDVALAPAPSVKEEPLAIHTLYLAHPDIQVQRAYTPLYAAPLASPSAASALLLIKRYASGEVGRYAHALRPGDEVWLRGPEKSWVARGDEEDVVLVSCSLLLSYVSR